MHQVPKPSTNPDGRVHADALATPRDWFAEDGRIRTQADFAWVRRECGECAAAQLGGCKP